MAIQQDNRCECDDDDIGAWMQLFVLSGCPFCIYEYLKAFWFCRWQCHFWCAALRRSARRAITWFLWMRAWKALATNEWFFPIECWPINQNIVKSTMTVGHFRTCFECSCRRMTSRALVFHAEAMGHLHSIARGKREKRKHKQVIIKITYIERVHA